MLVFEPIYTDGLAQISYLVGDSEAAVAAVIDPRRDADVYLDLAREKGLRIAYTIETHIHADFVSGAQALAERSGAEIIGGCSPDYGFELRQAADGEVLELGQVSRTRRAEHRPAERIRQLGRLDARRPAADLPDRRRQPAGSAGHAAALPHRAGSCGRLPTQRHDRLAERRPAAGARRTVDGARTGSTPRRSAGAGARRTLPRGSRAGPCAWCRARLRRHLPDGLGQLDRSRTVATYCGSGYRASIAASILKREGFRDVVNIPGSWMAWQRHDLPVKKSRSDG